MILFTSGSSTQKDQKDKEKNILKRDINSVLLNDNMPEKPRKKTKISYEEYNTSDSIKTGNTLPNERDYIAPWLTPLTASIKNSLARLHNEIIDFYQYIIPSEEEHNSRLAAIKKLMIFFIIFLYHIFILRLEEVIIESYPEVQILPFGSFKTKLYLPNADIDLVTNIH